MMIGGHVSALPIGVIAEPEFLVATLGEDGKGLSKIRVTLHETDLARAWFEGPV